ncbi:OLC1v1038522C1 [Oldenlandia corymbosa var. corymbosa]|uniref:OLC1v1038522C1 n=1 Tax=Oldenlandia corymbosa var. corymbosa TaxID=529605 RepID=A0AAV1D032_OLDCO|nr:OLC1v1038522C1 [Oldenlandia corymbosa var. corymbosa]
MFSVRLAIGMVKPCTINNIMKGSMQQLPTALESCQTTKVNMKASFNALKNTSMECFDGIQCGKLRDKWLECQGIKNWEGLLDPLDDDLRNEILRYGQFVEVAYRCFDFDTSSPTYATCNYSKDQMMAECGLGTTGYRVSRNLHATCSVQVPRWVGGKVPNWISKKSSWVGYVAVCDDKEEIARLGRRDVVIAYRGTATCLEWFENLRATLACLPDDMAPAEDCHPMVQSGFLSLYTSSTETHRSLQDSVKEEIEKLLEKYSDEPLSITITGHSLGAALATLTAYDITNTFKHAPLVTVVSFGGPRVGDRTFRQQLEKNGTKVLRIVNSDDVITKVPGFVIDYNNNNNNNNNNNIEVARNEEADDVEVGPAGGFPSWIQKRVEDTQWVYAEIGKELRLSSKDCPNLGKGDIVTCHDLKTYLHLVNNFVGSNCPIRATANRVLMNRKNVVEEKQLLFR